MKIRAQISANTALRAALLASVATVLLACEPPTPTDPQVDPQEESGQVEQSSAVPAAQPSESSAARSTLVAAKPGAPVTVDYEVLGTPAVDEPIELELHFRSELSGAVHASYRILDQAALSFEELPAQNSAVTMQAVDGAAEGLQRLQLRPHREGRHIVEVTAELQTESGPMRSVSRIPIEVNGLSAHLHNKQTQPLIQNQVTEDAQGEAVVSLPARED